MDIGDADVVLAPITTRERSGQGDILIGEWSECGLLKISWARLAKVMCLEKGDISRSLGRLTDSDQRELNESWQTLFSFE